MVPRVVVVIPCFRQAQYLPEAVASVAAQTYGDLECVVVDDGSPDDAAAVTGRLMRGLPNLRLLRQENRGIAEARNAGIRSSRAPLILPLDADDKLAPHAVARMVETFDAQPDLAIVGSWGREFGARSGLVHTVSAGLDRLLKGNTIMCASMFRREVYDRTGGFNPNMRDGYEDWDFWISMHDQGGKAHIIEEELLYYRQSGESRNDRAEAREIWLRARIVLNHPHLYEKSRVRLAEETIGKNDPDRLGAALRLRWIWYLVKDLRRKKATRELAALFGRA
jgi:glycosyltransferase involved in cell wall biosynthesis